MNDPPEMETLILTIRGAKVILAADLARLYGVAPRRLNEQVKRNAERFPDDFVCRLTQEETQTLRLQGAITAEGRAALRSQLATLRRGQHTKDPPLAANAVILKRLAEIDKTLLKQDAALREVDYKLQPLLQPQPPPRRKIGFNRKNKT
jgi:hypothetical protein